ncbi:MAG: hypothetical protein IT221_03315 [Fluviicola sp.]|nr:hypothetical protein [Fluviicola sp.]
MNTMLVSQENIKNYIPQREPFIMIDALVAASDAGFQTQFTISDDNLFLEENKLSESALVENIAQTCAAGFGYLNSLIEGAEPQLGFIGAVTHLEVFNTTQQGALIETEVKVLNTFENIHLVEGIARTAGTDLLKCQLKIVLA